MTGVYKGHSPDLNSNESCSNSPNFPIMGLMKEEPVFIHEV